MKPRIAPLTNPDINARLVLSVCGRAEAVELELISGGNHILSRFWHVLFVVHLFLVCSHSLHAQVLVPQLVGDWWQIAGNPDVSPFNGAAQEPVDFSIWQAADGTWQLWSCIRNTSYPGHTRLFHGWEATDLFDSNWTPTGVKMVSDVSVGEAIGGLQAPHVIKVEGTYHMLYGSWDHIAHATSTAGKQFLRVIQPDGTSSVFGAGEINPRDPMTTKIDGLYHMYYTTRDNEQGRVILRTGTDLNEWSPRQVVAYGGSAGVDWWEAECPFVYYHEDSEFYYLFRTQKYSSVPQTRVYRSADPAYFGIGPDADEYLVAQLPVAAPELVELDGKLYLAALNADLQGIRLAELRFVDPNQPVTMASGGLWHITERRMKSEAVGAFDLSSVGDATTLLNLPADDPRVVSEIFARKQTLNFNNSTGQLGQFANDEMFPGGNAGSNVAMRIDGSIRVTTDGVVTFGLTVNDGASLLIDGQEIIRDDTANAVTDHFASLYLSAGEHTVELVYFQQFFSAVLEVYISANAGAYCSYSGEDSPASGWQLLTASARPGDFNMDGEVNAADLVLWQAGYGLTSGADVHDGDANADGIVDGADYLIWQRNFGGDSQPLRAMDAVPEPSWGPLLLLLIVFGIVYPNKSRRWAELHCRTFSLIAVPKCAQGAHRSTSRAGKESLHQ